MPGHGFSPWGMGTCRGSIPPLWRFDFCFLLKTCAGGTPLVSLTLLSSVRVTPVLSPMRVLYPTWKPATYFHWHANACPALGLTGPPYSYAYRGQARLGIVSVFLHAFSLNGAAAAVLRWVSRRAQRDTVFISDIMYAEETLLVDADWDRFCFSAQTLDTVLGEFGVDLNTSKTEWLMVPGCDRFPGLAPLPGETTFYKRTAHTTHACFQAPALSCRCLVLMLMFSAVSALQRITAHHHRSGNLV